MRFQVTIETLRLLECLLEKPVDDILDSLILKHLASRGYFQKTTVVNGDETQVNGDDTKTIKNEDSKLDELDRVELEKIVNRLGFDDCLGVNIFPEMICYVLCFILDIIILILS